jgi:hypothetical protein
MPTECTGVYHMEKPLLEFNVITNPDVSPSANHTIMQ